MKSLQTSQESKSPHGGKRAGAGRKPSTLSGIAKKLPRESAELLLAEIKAQVKWKQLANSEDERIRLDTLKYLTDRAYGKAPQSVEHSGPEGGPIEASVTVKFVKSGNESRSS